MAQAAFPDTMISLRDVVGTPTDGQAFAWSKALGKFRPIMGKAGPLWFNVRDYGASTSSADNTPAFQAAHDAAAAAADAALRAAVVYMPGDRGSYTCKGPIYCDAD